ncbi:unnamed protein product, partial [Heterosigma akashiwo]
MEYQDLEEELFSSEGCPSLPEYLDSSSTSNVGGKEINAAHQFEAEKAAREAASEKQSDDVLIKRIAGSFGESDAEWHRRQAAREAVAILRR